MNTLIYDTLHFDQYSRLSIHLNIFILFLAITSKTNMKLEKNFPLVCRARWEESLDVQHQTFKKNTKPYYSFEDQGTDRQINFGMYSQSLKDLQMIKKLYDKPIKAENSLATRKTI